MKSWIITDLDGTLCNIDHRVDYAKAGLWEEFHQRCYDDLAHPEVAEFLQHIGKHFELLAVTGRNDKWRLITQTWLNEHEIPIDALLMRPDDDYSPDNVLKLQMIEEYFGSKEEVLKNVAFCLDDRDRVVEAFRNYGLPCWQVREGTF